MKRYVRMQSPSFAFVCAFAMALPLASVAQQAATQSSDAPLTLRTQAKIVVVDVTVTDGKNKPVHGLTQDKFVLLEDHEEQKIKGFEEHAAPSTEQLERFPPVPKLPPGVFTNYVPAPSDGGPLNILLIDALNTPTNGQQLLRQQLLKFLDHQRPGTSIAIFGLNARLALLQGFSSDPNLLKRSIALQAAKPSAMLDNATGSGGGAASQSDQLLDSGLETASTPNSGPGPNDLVSNLKAFEDRTRTDLLQRRIEMTLDAMNQLARYLANIPGRKNLIWFSGAFPLSVLPSSDGSSDPFASILNSHEEYSQTVNLLSRAQVAVYPVDARGLQTSPVFSAANNGNYSGDPSRLVRDINEASLTNDAEHQTMLQMAKETGGQAFIETNGLAEAVTEAIDDGANFYTLVYTPTNGKWNGNYRHIDVKLDGLKYHLTFRRGYYATDPNSPFSALANASAKNAPGANPQDPQKVGESLMQQAMAHAVPGASQIVYTLRVVPMKAANATEQTVAKDNAANAPNMTPIQPPYRNYRVDFGTDPAKVQFTQGADGNYHGTLEFISFLYTMNGELVNGVSNRMELALLPARYAALIKAGGVTFHQEISVPVKGEFSLRTGVHDVGSNHIGTAEVPLSVVKNLPPLGAPAQPAGNNAAAK